MGRITNEQIEKINEVYLICHTYAETARRVGVSPSTVKKYIIKDYFPKEKENNNFIKITENDITLPTKSCIKIQEDMSEILVLSEDEKAEIKELWKEILV